MTNIKENEIRFFGEGEFDSLAAVSSEKNNERILEHIDDQFQIFN
jgi:hypothetical protein